MSTNDTLPTFISATEVFRNPDLITPPPKLDSESAKVFDREFGSIDDLGEEQDDLGEEKESEEIDELGEEEDEIGKEEKDFEEEDDLGEEQESEEVDELGEEQDFEEEDEFLRTETDLNLGCEEEDEFLRGESDELERSELEDRLQAWRIRRITRMVQRFGVALTVLILSYCILQGRCAAYFGGM